MKKYKVLLLGYSDLAKNRLIKTFINDKVKFCVASKSEKKKSLVPTHSFNLTRKD